MSILVLCGIPLIMVLGNSMLIPILPQMKEALSLSQFQVSLVITLFSIPAGLVIPFLGFLSDRMRRKPIIVISLLVYAIGGLMAGLAAIWGQTMAYPLIMGGRIIQGVGAAGTAPLAMALVGDLYQNKTQRSRILGFLETANGLGKVISPILGSLLGFFAWWAVFFLFPFLCLPIALGLALLVQEPPLSKEAPSFAQYGQSLWQVFQKKGVSLLSAFLAGATVLFVLFGLLFFLSDFLEVAYKIEGILKGLIIAIPVLAMALTSSLVGLFTVKKTSRYKTLIIIGLGLLALSSALLALFSESIVFFLVLLVWAGIGTGMALTSLNTLITSSCSREERGMVTSLYGSVRFLGVAVGPPFVGFLMEKSILWTFMLPAIWTVGVGILNFFFLRKSIARL